MPLYKFTEEARRLITARCLIAADIDKTVLAQEDDQERQRFLANIAPQLLLAAAYGTNLAFLTGNSMHELSSRFLKWLIGYLCHTDHLYLLDRFHFFCNSGGVYTHFSLQDEELRGWSSLKEADQIFGVITEPVDGGKRLAVRPRFVDAGYIERCRVPEDDVAKIQAILEKTTRGYIDDLRTRHDFYRKTYDLASVCDNGELIPPRPDSRIVRFGSDESRGATVQITLKPILSFRHALDPRKCYGKDLRARLAKVIQRELDTQGLGHYVARPAGRSSIDVTSAKLDKAYALEFLIDRLNLQGLARHGQQFGSNAIYFGDEVIVGEGNDYPVTRIPGLLVFAVNSDRDLIPFLSHVFVPSAILEGPDATAEVLAYFNKCALTLLNNFDHLPRGQKQVKIKTALEVLKEEIFATRIREKITALKSIDRLSVEDWQVLHAFVTIMCRNDPAARQWLSMLIGELDAIMTQLGSSKVSAQPALGASHPDR